LKGIHSTLLVATLLASTACGRKAQDVTHTVLPPAQAALPGAAPAAHDQPFRAPDDPANNPDDPRNHKDRKVVGQDKLKKRWRGIRIRIVDVPGGRQALWDVHPGRPVPIPGLGLSVKVNVILSHFAMGGGVVRADGDDSGNPAAEVQVFEDGKQVWEGWMFQRFPDLRQFCGNRYQLVLKDILPALKK